MKEVLPYIVSIICAFIAGFSSYAIARKKGKDDIQILVKNHELDIIKEREKFTQEIERMEIEHKHQMELLQKQNENALGTGLVSSLFSEAMKTPEMKEKISEVIRNSGRKNT